MIEENAPQQEGGRRDVSPRIDRLDEAAFNYRGPRPGTNKRDAFEVIGDLVAGNERWMTNSEIRPNQCAQTKEKLALGQNPEVILVTCSDSRVAPELIFDSGIGQIFTLRGAGNVLSGHDVASIELALSLWEPQVVMVLGHHGCGAIQGAVEGLPSHMTGSNHIVGLIAHLRENISGHENDRERATEANVRREIERLASSSNVVAEAVRCGHLVLIGGVYDVASRKVHFI